MSVSASVAVIGDGATGLSAALLLAKNDVDVDVFGEDETKLHKAYLYNYLGIEEIHGSDFAEVGRQQSENYGAEFHDERVEDVEKDDDGFTLTAGSGDEYTADYVVLATGLDDEIAEKMGVEFDDDGGVEIDTDCRTSVDGVYAGGWIARPEKIQVSISAGDGAVAALDILSEEKGEAFHDFDVP
ncbi:MAG: FAD-dependent oxidoreductase [Halobacteria archaeon]|nr:FAD-dependent oxidoreductase [Halobacteria archaeon]